MDQIIIEQLELFCNHGVLEEENRLGQKFLVSAILYTDTKHAGKTDDVTDSIHYGEVCHKIKEILENNTYKLLERAAETVCERLLLEYKMLQKITLKIEKPWAPIGLPLKNVGVQITRQWHKAYIAIGSNIGNKEEHFENALKAFKESPYIKLRKISDFILTKPYGYTQQDDFLNGCFFIETLFSPQELLQFCHETEQKENRTREIHWGPRTLDLDIIFYDDLMMEEPDLVIPHIEMHKRAFVLQPMNEIAPGYVHPVYKKTINSLYQELLASLDK